MTASPAPTRGICPQITQITQKSKSSSACVFCGQNLLAYHRALNAPNVQAQRPPPETTSRLQLSRANSLEPSACKTRAAVRCSALVERNRHGSSFFRTSSGSACHCSAERAARYLGFSAHEIPILVQKGLLTPLGHPARNNVRFFAAVKLQELRQDVKWLAKATDATSEAWRIKNAKSAAGKERAD